MYAVTGYVLDVSFPTDVHPTCIIKMRLAGMKCTEIELSGTPQVGQELLGAARHAHTLKLFPRFGTQSFLPISFFAVEILEAAS